MRVETLRRLVAEGVGTSFLLAAVVGSGIMAERLCGGNVGLALLCNALATAVAIDDRPSCFRFPRGNGVGVDMAVFGVSPSFKGTPWEVLRPPFPGPGARCLCLLAVAAAT